MVILIISFYPFRVPFLPACCFTGKAKNAADVEKRAGCLKSFERSCFF
jgi:hypothetical protein